MGNPARLSSIDALRGLAVAAMLLVNNAGDWNHVYPWLQHSAWHGCTAADFIFPFFMLIVGVSLHLALEPKLARGDDPSTLLRGVLGRAARIVLLGVALHVAATLLMDGRAFRLMGVLQRIGICFGVAGLVALYVRGAKAQWALFALCLFGYWGLLALGGSYSPNLNLADRIDNAVLGKLAYSYNAATGLAQEPEGLLSTLPALATVLLGLRAGAWLRGGQVQRLVLFGVLAAAAGWLWAFVLPLNKHLWTPSFVLWTGGFGLVCMALAHRLVDLRGWPALGRAFGVNAITAYAGAWLATCVLEGMGWMGPLYRTVFGATLGPRLGDNFASFAFALAFTGVFAVLMWGMERRGWRISV